MVTLANTTYYPAILLRRRWLEAGAGGRGAFDITVELGRVHTEPPLNSPEVSELEGWSAGIASVQAQGADLAPITNDLHVSVPAALPGPTLRTLRAAPRRERQPASARQRFHVARRGGLSPAPTARV